MIPLSMFKWLFPHKNPSTHVDSLNRIINKLFLQATTDNIVINCNDLHITFCKLYICDILTPMGQDYKKLLNKKKKKYCDVKTMGVNIDKNEYYEIIMSNSAHPENITNKK